MTFRNFAAGAALALLAGPAWADCQDEIQELDAAVVAAETGAAAGDGSLPATEHQEEVLSGGDAPMETAAGTVGDVEAVSPHQQQVVRELDADEKAEASQLIDEARELAAAGDEEACMAKLAEVRQLVGTE